MSKFSAKLALHIEYANEESSKIAGHRQFGHAIVNVKDERWFSDKDAFMGLIIKSFEQFYEAMKNGFDEQKNQSVDERDIDISSPRE